VDIGNSKGIIIPKSIRKSWLNAVEFRTGLMTGRELRAMIEGYKFLDDRKILVVIPLFEEDFKSKLEEEEEQEEEDDSPILLEPSEHKPWKRKKHKKAPLRRKPRRYSKKEEGGEE